MDMIDKFKKYHDTITDCFYKGKEFKGVILTKETFEKLHSINHLELAKYQRANNMTPQIELSDTKINTLIAAAKVILAIPYNLEDTDK